jgi:hypothetical protein
VPEKSGLATNPKPAGSVWIYAGRIFSALKSSKEKSVADSLPQGASLNFCSTAINWTGCGEQTSLQMIFSFGLSLLFLFRYLKKTI